MNNKKILKKATEVKYFTNKEIIWAATMPITKKHNRYYIETMYNTVSFGLFGVEKEVNKDGSEIKPSIVFSDCTPIYITSLSELFQQDAKERVHSIKLNIFLKAHNDAIRKQYEKRDLFMENFNARN